MVEYTENIAIRVREGDEKVIEEYAEEHGLSKSGAARKLLYEGMIEERVHPRTRRAGQSGDLFEIIQTTLLIAILAYLIIGAI